jgi:hypothetical protein
MVLNTHPKRRKNETDNIPFHIGELVTKIRRARSRWQRSRNNDDRLIHNRLRRKLHTPLANVKYRTFEHYTASLSKDDHTIWKATKMLERTQISIEPTRKADRSWAKSDSEKTTTFANILNMYLHHFLT